MSAKVKFWIAGVIIAVIGILLARVVAPMYQDWTQFGIYIAGIIIAVAGLGVIMYGIKAK